MSPEEEEEESEEGDGSEDKDEEAPIVNEGNREPAILKPLDEEQGSDPGKIAGIVIALLVVLAATVAFVVMYTKK